MIGIEELKKFKIFKELNERELGLIVDIAKEDTCEAGARIFAEKALATNLYLILEGKIEIKIRCAGDERVVVLDQIEPGEIFGWSAVTEPYTFTAAAWTLEKTKLIVLKGERLKELFEKNNHLGYRVIKEIASVISRRLKAMSSKFAANLCTVR